MLYNLAMTHYSPGDSAHYTCKDSILYPRYNNGVIMKGRLIILVVTYYSI